MASHLVGYYKSVLSAGTLAALTPVPDPTVTVQGNDLLVPAKYNQVVFGAALTVAHALTQAQLQAPSLRGMYFPDLTPRVLAATFANIQRLGDLSQTPLQLQTNEGLQFFSDGGGDGTTAEACYGLVWLSDGALTPAKGKVYTMRATAAVALAAGSWVNGPLTFNQTLPVGTYSIIGMRAEGANLVAARLVFIGQSAITRPGVPGAGGANTSDLDQFRMGAAGAFGSFDSTTPPSVDCLGVTDTSQVFEFDLVKTA